MKRFFTTMLHVNNRNLVNKWNSSRNVLKHDSSCQLPINHRKSNITHITFSLQLIIKTSSLFILVTDCLLSEWGAWTECDAKCGTGTRSRTRSILRAPENGGKHCASLTQKQGCEGYRCKSYHERKALSGRFTKLILKFLRKQRHL